LSQEQQPQPGQRWKRDDYSYQGNSLICGGLLAAFLVILQVFIQTGLHNRAAYVIIFAFAVSAPCLVARLLMNSHEVKYPYMRSAAISNTIYGIGVGFGFLGFAATFWYIYWIAGLVFFSISVIAFAFSIIHAQHLSQDKEGNYRWK